MVSWALASLPPKKQRHLDRIRRFTRLTVVTNRQTDTHTHTHTHTQSDHATPSEALARVYVLRVMRAKMHK